LPKRVLVEEFQNDISIGISKTCRLLNISRSILAYKSLKNDDDLYHKLITITENHPLDGFWKCYHRLRNQGEQVIINGFIESIKTNFILLFIMCLISILKANLF